MQGFHRFLGLERNVSRAIGGFLRQDRREGSLTFCDAAVAFLVEGDLRVARLSELLHLSDVLP